MTNVRPVDSEVMGGATVIGGLAYELVKEDNSVVVDGDESSSKEIPTGRYGTGKLTGSRVDFGDVLGLEKIGCG